MIKLPGFLQRKEIILGTSDTWSMRQSYYIEDCRICVVHSLLLHHVILLYLDVVSFIEMKKSSYLIHSAAPAR
mgnify:CR=1 FL=1